MYTQLLIEVQKSPTEVTMVLNSEMFVFYELFPQDVLLFM